MMASLPLYFVLAVSSPGEPVQASAAEVSKAPGTSLAADEVVDTENSVDDADTAVGWMSRGDFRGLLTSTEEDTRDGGSIDTDNLIGRLRTEVTWTLTPRLRASARLAGSCTDDDCNLDFVMDREISGATLERGKFTFDELFLHFFQSERFDLAIGRLQTKLVTRAGVYSKSLDRADSDNANINWTDGLHGTWHHANGWESHLILQHNSSSGAGNVRRGPLNFESSDSRITYVVGFENLNTWGPVVQRAFDINYLPSSLLKDGVSDGRVEDYWGVVGRLAAEWSLGAAGRRLRVAGELAYAPKTPTRTAVNLGGTGDADGLAWNAAASLMDFSPGHDIGVNYGRIDPGWLLSPDFTDNEEQIEIRYRWKVFDTFSLELRARQRKDLKRQEGSVQKRDRFDAFLRLTKRFSLRGQ